MTDEKAISETDASIPSGGATLLGLDLTNPKDQAMVRQAIKSWPKRWRGLSDAKKDRFVEDIEIGSDIAREIAQNSEDPDLKLKAVMCLHSGARTVGMMEGQNQADEHLADKNARLDEGKATENIAGVQYTIVEARKEP